MFDQVKEDHRKHPDFIGRFLEQERDVFKDKINKAKRKRLQMPVARQELFSDEEDEEDTRQTKCQKMDDEQQEEPV